VQKGLGKTLSLFFIDIFYEVWAKGGPLALGARHRVSSILTTSIFTGIFIAFVAQLVEQRTFNP
jgi:hypothetical protein